VETHAKRLLSIGEFAAATQLSPKALRLYDEQRLLPPAHIDADNGYRYYRSDQVPKGRLIRTLRETGLSLTDIGSLIVLEGARAEALLNRFSKEQSQRHAREKRAWHSAFIMLRRREGSSAPKIIERSRTATPVVALAFTACRARFVECFRAALSDAETRLARSQLVAAGTPACGLIDPLSDEDGRLEVVIPVAASTQAPNGMSSRVLPAADCAAISVADSAHAPDLTGAVDALFDWFDRRAYRAIETPFVSFGDGDDHLQPEVAWAYEQNREE